MIVAPFHGAKAAIFVGDRLLVTLRDDKPDIDFPDHWDFPGGGREQDETPEETVLREIREEVGLDLPADRLDWRRAFPSGTRAGMQSWFFVIHLSPDAEAEIVLGDEGQGWRLVAPGEYLAMPRAIPFLQDRLQIWLSERDGPGIMG